MSKVYLKKAVFGFEIGSRLSQIDAGCNYILQREGGRIIFSPGIIVTNPDWFTNEWIPIDNGKDYYFVSFSNGDINIGASFWHNDNIDRRRFSIGNCFETREEVEEVMEKIRKVLKGETICL